MENYNKRWIEIIYYFLSHAKNANGDNLALSVGVSSRTIRNDIKKINNILNKYDAEIVSEIGVGYFLRINNKNSFQNFLEEIKAAERFRPFKNIVPSSADERIWYITSQLLIHSLDQADILSFNSLEEQLFISESTLKKDLIVIGNILKEYGLKISETKKYGLVVIGEESKIRFCISQYVFNNKNNVMSNDQVFYEDIFDKKDIDMIQNILTRAIIKYDLKLTDIAFKNLIIHTLIMLKRSKGKQHVVYKSEDIKMFENSQEYLCAFAIIEKIEKEFGISLIDEIFYLTQHLVASQRFLIENIEDDYVYKDIVLRILLEINETMHIDLSDDLQLINGLAIHLNAALQRVRFEMNIRNEFIDVLKNSYPLAFELAAIAGKIIENNYSFMLKEAEIGFLTMHFGAALERKGLNIESEDKEKQDERLKVALVCIAGVAMALLLKERLLQRFGQYIDIVRTSPAQQVDEELLDEVDMVLTTVDLPDFKSSKIVKIGLFPDADDFNEIEQLIVDDKQKYEIDYRNIFKEDLFFKNKVFNTKDDVLEFMTNSMIKKGYIDENIKLSIFKREAISTTEMGGLIAIPHAMLNDIESFAVSVLILSKPIVWEKQKVQVVFLLNIPKKKYKVWELVFKNLYHNLISNAGVNRLIKHQNYKQFILDMQGR